MNLRASKGLITGGYSDLVLAGGVLLIMALMVMRLPTAIIDGLVAINISMGVGLLLIAIYVPSPVMFNSFPSVLLISTLFRLALSVATTRLILLEADAGNIIQAFGSFVAGGNLVVGIVVFTIITVVQFIVIAKGAERVAEVSARFTLDAMPGKQMSIDSDLRSGLIEKDEAKRRRKILEQESQLNGALDGAMKFVKGDAIASIIIVLVNLVGGLTIGMLQRGLEFGVALSSYSILTIGDGMVAQIPALLGAMAAGLVVTRTSNEDDQHLGATIGRQLGAQPKAVMVTGFIALLLALVPGFPSWVFLSVGLVLLTTAHLSAPGKLAHVLAQIRGDQSFEILAGADAMPETAILLSEPLVVELPAQNLGQGAHTSFHAQLDEIRSKIGEELGVPLPEATIKWCSSDSKPRILIYDIAVPAPSGRKHSNGVADEPPSSSRAVTTSGVQESDLLQHFETALRTNAGQFLGVQEVSEILETATLNFPALVREATRHVSNQHIAEVLRNLVNENIPVRNLRDILEALAEWGDKEKTSAGLTEFARMGLKRYMSARFVQKDDMLNAIIISPTTEASIRSTLKETVTGIVMTLAPDQVNELRQQVSLSLNQLKEKPGPVLITAIDLRRHVKIVMDNLFPLLPVLSYQELLPQVSINPVAEVSL